MAINRIYVVKNGDKERLIEATGKSNALSYAVKTTLTVELASQGDLVRLLGDGVAVEASTDAAGE
jgi:hypothetical protein